MNRTPVRQRLRAAWTVLPSGHWFYLLILLVPTALVDLTCVTLRLAHPAGGVPVSFGTWAWVLGIRSDLFFHLANITFWVGVFALVRRPIPRRIATLIFHVWFVALAFFIVIAQMYFMLLDVVLTVDSVYLVSLLFQIEVVKIIQAEVEAFIPGLGLLLILLANLLPPLANRWWKPRWLHRWPADYQPAVSRKAIAGAVVAIVVASLGIALLPNPNGTTQFTQNRVVNVTAQAIKRAVDPHPAGFRQPTTADLPLHRRLVKTSTTKPMNVVQIVLESTGWDATTLANPKLKTTPYLARLARKSLLARRAYTVLPHTSKSLTGSQCGIAPPIDTTATEAQPGGVGGRCFASMLNDQGYSTAFFQSATRIFENRDKVVENFGFQDFYPWQAFDTTGFSTVNTLGYEDDIMVKPSLRWAEKHRSKPFAITYMTVTAHTEYVAPKGWPNVHYVDDPKHNTYLNTVRYQDSFVRHIIEGFTKKGLADNTIFVIMGDHGDGFREHGRRLHSDTIWDEAARIPLIIYAPGIPRLAGKTIETPVVNAAVAPTMIDLLGYRVRGGAFENRSMLQGAAKPFHVSCWDPSQCTALVFPKSYRKFIYFYGQRPSQLFDIRSDPGERHDLIGTLSAAKRHRIEHGIELWTADVNARHALSRSLAAKGDSSD
jgi:lipoteichoic acid synthase